MAFTEKHGEGLLGLLKYATDAYVLLDEKGKILESNKVFDLRFQHLKQAPGDIAIREMLHGIDFRSPAVSSEITCGDNKFYLIRIEEEINREFSEQILSVISEVCFQLDENFNILYANQRAFESWDATPGTILGQNIFKILDEIYSPLAYHLKAALDGQAHLFEEIYLPRIDRWIFSNAHPNNGGLIVLHSDVTEKIKYKNRLKEKELQLKTLVDNIPDLVTRWNKDAKLIFANTSFNKKDINLAEKADIKSKKQSADLPLIDWEEKIRRVYLTGESIQHHTTLFQGEEIAFLDSIIVPEKDAEGDISSVLAISRDVTENKLAQQKIIDSNDMLRSVFDASVNGIVVLEPVMDKKGIIVDFYCGLSNTSATKILQIDPSGKRFSEVIQDRSLNFYLERLLDTVQNGTRIQEEVKISHHSSVLWLDLMVSKIKTGILITFSDISEKKKAEQALLNSYRLLQNLIDGTSIALLYLKPILDPGEKFVDLEFLNINQQAIELFLLDKEKITGSTLLESCPELKKEPLVDNIRKFLKEGSPSRFETSLSLGDRQGFYDISMSKHGENIILSAMDVTYKVISQRKIRQMEQKQHKELLNAIMQTQEEERRRIAESLHNEFGQLLNVSLLELGRDKPTVSQFLNEAIVKVRTISHELMPPVLKDFGLAAAFRELFDSPMLTNKQIVPRLRISGLGERLNTHLEIALYRIVQEMLNNIVKHSGAKEVNFVFECSPEYITILLQDDGVGFDTENRPGFGLKYITSRIELLNGKLEISSSSESGTRYSVQIPISLT